LANAAGVIDHECAPAVSVPKTCAPGLVDTLIVTKEFAWGRWSTVAVQGIPVDPAFEGDAVRAVNASVETAMALKALATLATGIRNKAFTLSTVTTKPALRYARKPDLVRTGMRNVASS
jgi:hypothetical protein